MGCGKSVVSQKLASKINFPVVELDQMIEKKAGMSVLDIFSNKGELYFRKLERALFLELLQAPNNLIISTGGGTPCYFNNHELLKQDNVVSVYLKASIDTLYNRLIQEKEKRPLIAAIANSEVKEFIAKHIFDRSFYYHQAAHKVDVDDKTIDQIVDEISSLLS